MFKRISAIVMVFAMVAMLSVTAFAEVDREAVEKQLVEHLWNEDELYKDYEGYWIPVEDNPTSSLDYCLYIKKFVTESDESVLENLDLTDTTSRSINRFVRNYYAEWLSEQPDMVDCIINDGNHYEYVEENDEKWVVKDSDGNLHDINLEKTDTSFVFYFNGKEVGTYERLFQYAYLNDEDEIAYSAAERAGEEVSEFSSEYSDEEGMPSTGIAGTPAEDNNQPVTPSVVSEVDRQNVQSALEENAATEPPVSAEKKNNTPVIIGALAVTAVIAVIIVMLLKKKKEN